MYNILFTLFLFQALPYVCLLIAMLFFIYAIIGMQVSLFPYHCILHLSKCCNFTCKLYNLMALAEYFPKHQNVLAFWQLGLYKLSNLFIHLYLWASVCLSVLKIRDGPNQLFQCFFFPKIL